ncbi:hypothetical protein AB0M20_15540 [Actinoplanes sp. NPDC051633]|uniref:hypothetical protein n=1 Tax=Actinoplanes sp. NPDC051633 TaxID=3155670 RepID=UPI00342785E5
MGKRKTAVVVPAWLGPNKMYNSAKGQSYVFGLFTIGARRISFAADEEVSVDVARKQATIEWPFWLAGGGCRLKTPSGAWIVAFGRPFPDAPAPDQEKIEAAATALEGLQAAAGQVSDLADLGAGVLKDLVGFAQAMTDIRKGRRAAETVKAALGT